MNKEKAKMDLYNFHWLNQPGQFRIGDDTVKIVTEPMTDFWQRTYYGFRHDNAHAFLALVSRKEFSFTVKAKWVPEKRFDQCGVILYQDENNWFKASVEYDNEQFSRLGSVVTNQGYSDWATTDIDSACHQLFYRLSRRGQDFLIESSEDGYDFRQMRIFHMVAPIDQAKIGVYACSPLDSSIEAVFSDFALEDCAWALYADPDQA